jgi:MFS family permease
MTFAAVWDIVFLALMASSQNYAWLLTVRFLAGMGIGVGDSIFPIWTAEVTQATSRGSHIALEMCGAGLGVCTGFWIPYACSHSSNLAFGWRFPVAWPIISITGALVLVLRLPESPRYLLSRGCDAQARKSYSRLYVEDGKLDEMFEELKADLGPVTSTTNARGYLDFLTGRHGRNISRRVLLTVLIQGIGSLFIGFGILLSFSGQVFGLAGLTGNNIAIVAGANLTSYFLGFFVGPLVCDRIGRRPLFLWGTTICATMLLLIAILCHFLTRAEAGSSKQKALGGVVAAFIFIYSFSHASSYATMAWVVPAEIFPASHRSYGGGLSIATFAIGNGVSTIIASYLLSSIGTNTFFLFGALSTIGVLILYLLLPETALLSLEQMHEVFDGDLIVVPWARKLFKRD